MRKINYNIFFIILLILIGIITHIEWFSFSSVLSHGDHFYRPYDYLSNARNAFNSWIGFLNLGEPNIQIYFYPFILIWEMLTKIGLFSYAVKLTHFIPIAILGFISPYFLIKHLTKSPTISFVSALFYGSQIHFLVRQTSHTSISVIYALAPLIILLFIKALEKNKLTNWLNFSLIFFIGTCYELRIMYIITIILFIYFLFYKQHNKIKKYYKNILVCGTIIILLSSFWIIPTFFSNIGDQISNKASRNIFGDDLYNINRAFTISEHSWTGTEPIAFEPQPIMWQLWLIPLIIFSTLLFKSSKTNRHEILFFSTVALIGILLTKQSGEPWGNLYIWLRENFPGFVIFRSASKLYLLTFIGYLGLLGYFMLSLKVNIKKTTYKTSYILIIFIIVLISCINLKPLITKEINGLFINKTIPEDYKTLNNFISNQTEYFRTLWVPRMSRWSTYSMQHPIINYSKTYNKSWSNYNYLDIFSNYSKAKKEMLLFSSPQDMGDQILDNLTIKYIIVPPSEDHIYDVYNVDRQFFVNYLEDIPYLEKIDIGINTLDIYENKNFKPHIHTTSNIDYYDSKSVSYPTTNETIFNQASNDLISNIDNIIIPIRANQEKLEELKNYYQEAEKDKNIAYDNFQLYYSTFLDDPYKITIPRDGEYKILFSDNNLLKNNENLSIVIGDKITKKKSNKIITRYNWHLFNTIYLQKGNYDLQLLLDSKIYKTLNSGDLVLIQENDIEVKLPDISYQQVNSAEYLVQVNNASESFPLIFNEKYHKNWQIYINSKLVEAEHLSINQSSNIWWIDISILEEDGLIQKNTEGIYNFSIKIKFRSQIYLTIGELISIITILIIIIYQVRFTFLNQKAKLK